MRIIFHASMSHWSRATLLGFIKFIWKYSHGNLYSERIVIGKYLKLLWNFFWDEVNIRSQNIHIVWWNRNNFLTDPRIWTKSLLKWRSQGWNQGVWLSRTMIKTKWKAKLLKNIYVRLGKYLPNFDCPNPEIQIRKALVSKLMIGSRYFIVSSIFTNFWFGVELN